MKEKLLAMFLAVMMAVSLLPGTAFAAGSDFVIEDGVLVEYKGSGGAVTIPDSVTEIGGWAFAYCDSLTSVTIPDSVTSIGRFAFIACDNLTSVTIPDSVTTMGEHAFYVCKNLASVTLSNSVAFIASSAFAYDSSLTSVTIPDSVTEIGGSAFERCSGLTRVFIPASVTAIWGYAFSDCDSLKDVYYGGSESQWKQIAIYTQEGGNAPLLSANIHYNSTMPSVTFTDLPGWCATEINWAVDEGITNGVGNNRFDPSSTCTHEQILTFLYRADRGEGGATAEDMAKAVSWAQEKGMIDSSFNAKDPCTRADAVSYICQVLGGKGGGDASFDDVDADADYAGAVAWAVSNGVVNGYAEDNTFRPGDTCTRAQIATMLYRAYVQSLSE